MSQLPILAAALIVIAAAPAASSSTLLAEERSESGTLDHPGGGAPTREECKAETPVLVCTTGVHTRGGGTIGHGFTGLIGATYTGTAESTLTWVRGTDVVERVLRCNYSNGLLTSCTGAGEFPPSGSAFAHDCISYSAGTTTPGGSGKWGCFSTHD